MVDGTTFTPLPFLGQVQLVPLLGFKSARMCTLFTDVWRIGDAEVRDRLVHDVVEHFHMLWRIAMHAAADVLIRRIERPHERGISLDAVLKNDTE